VIARIFFMSVSENRRTLLAKNGTNTWVMTPIARTLPSCLRMIDSSCWHIAPEEVDIGGTGDFRIGHLDNW